MRTLLVFLKYPEPGAVKTRLAEAIGPKRAAELCREWMETVFRQMQPLRESTRVVACYDGAAREAFAAWHDAADEWWPQPAGDLGARLDAAFRHFQAGGEPAAAIGTDCPQLTALHVEAAFKLLAGCDAVFGPAEDGGYYLVGLAQYRSGFFEGIPWSTSETLAAHRALCERRGWSCGLLTTLADIDTIDDLRRHEQRRPGRTADEVRLAVVIPTLNEEAGLARTLDALESQRAEIDELVVVDGGSSDATVAVAENRGATVIAVDKPGRGNQIAAALARLDVEAVLVVHADMILPEGALARVRQHLAEEPDCPGGCLGHRFDRAGKLLGWTERWDERRARRGMAYGDQAQFFRPALLERVGGFPAQPIMEDVELSRRLERWGRTAYLDCPVLVSPRRYERYGWLRTTIVNWLLRVAYRLGGVRACGAIHRYYYRRR